MKVLVVGSFEWEQYAPAIYNGFKSLGHQVEKIDIRDFLYKDNNICSSYLNKIQNRFHFGGNIIRYNRRIVSKTKEFLPNLVFLYRCYSVYSKTLKELKKNGCKVFSYNNDDPFSGVPSKSYYRHFLNNAHFCDINFVYRKKNIEDFKNVGIHNVRLLLPHYLSQNNYYMGVEKDIPVAFIGHFENDGRDLLIKKMLEAKIPVTVFGDEAWKKAPLYSEIKECIKSSRRGEEYNKTLNRIKIALIFLSKINRDTYTRRSFEIPITKTLILSEYTDDMNALFPENECAVYFRNVEELVYKAKSLLDNEYEINRISENGFLRLKQLGGSEIDRVKEIIEIYENLI
ncbi:glycosyltransferase family protein [Capnocytophaga canimorsus]|uniref:glycosyltransferase family protein n=1 Tax=Capnocytophaga canimorsus TaxID=28188 RepID=UPI0005898BE4|nr:glycosyltransferase [Capnocytophaga canimorsus]CEN44697.1 conserved hypothetical protein [Capnocytophaga canimorsus]SMD28989.1 conserved hypothetical protein [Capnocytophaga canimorsus]VEJ19449.1 Uncharacterized protein conserved in bacteria [Capnocytophaga canimorsus]